MKMEPYFTSHSKINSKQNKEPRGTKTDILNKKQIETKQKKKIGKSALKSKISDQ